jgi:type IV secretion system protein VirD4
MINNCRVVQCFGALTMNAAAEMASLTGVESGDYVLDLKPDEIILQLAGDAAIVARLPDYLLDPPFATQFDPNPYYQDESLIVRTPMPRIQLREPEAEMVAAPSPVKVYDPLTPDPLLDRLLALWD